jgi:hypothetical protein
MSIALVKDRSGEFRSSFRGAQRNPDSSKRVRSNEQAGAALLLDYPKNKGRIDSMRPAVP